MPNVIMLIIKSLHDLTIMVQLMPKLMYTGRGVGEREGDRAGWCIVEYCSLTHAYRRARNGLSTLFGIHAESFTHS